MKTGKKFNIGLIIVIIFVIVILLLCWKSFTSLSKFKIKDETSNIENAKKYGDNVVGWLRVEGTNIDLALISRNNVADVSPKEFQFAWTNSFPDKQSNHFTFISHNIRNVSRNPIVRDDTMTYFEQLMSFIYPDFVKENQFIEFTDYSSKTSIYKIYGVSLVKENQNMSYYDTFSEKELSKYIKKVKKESMFDIDVDVNNDDMLLTLYTCTRFYGGGGTYSFRVDARKLREGEKMKYSKVDINKNYKKISDRMKAGEKNEEV